MEYKDIERVTSEAKKIQIKGKDYVPVEERVKAFFKLFPGNGFIHTEPIQLTEEYCVFKASVGYYSDGDPVVLGTGFAREKSNDTFINKTSYVENCESSAVGRAIGMIGIGLTQGIASADEVQNAINNQQGSDTIKRGEKLFCTGCGGQILPAEKSYSVQHYGAALCRDCQSKRKK